MNEAIKLAIEKGGYQLTPKEWGYSPLIDQTAKWGNPTPQGLNPDIFWVRNGANGRRVQYRYAEVAINPLFWQALGKALGWTRLDRYVGTWGGKVVDVADWQHHALDFMYCKLTGGDEEKFWKELLSASRMAEPSKRDAA